MEYPSLFTRLKAFCIDTFIMLLLLFAVFRFFSKIEFLSDYVRVFVFLLVFFLYDPWLTSARGGTIGHKFMKLKVVKRTTGEFLSFKTAFVRSSLKALLGWISIFTLNASKQKQAIHDMVVNSVVSTKK